MAIVNTADIGGKILNFSNLNIKTNVTIHKKKIKKSLNKNNLFIGGIELFINPNL